MLFHKIFLIGGFFFTKTIQLYTTDGNVLTFMSVTMCLMGSKHPVLYVRLLRTNVNKVFEALLVQCHVNHFKT